MPGQKVPIQFPLSTAPGTFFSEGRGRMINAYVEPLDNSPQGTSLWRRSPGCFAFGAGDAANWTYWALEVEWFNVAQTASLPAGAYRGGIFVNDTLYAVIGNGVYTITSSGSASRIGTISGTDKVFLARNNAFIPDIVCVAEAGAFIFSSAAVFVYPDVNVGSPSCVVGHEGFFIFGYGNGDLLSSDINTTTINPLNLAETNTNPDGIIQIISYQGQLYAFGNKTIEIWGFPVNPTGFPFTRVGYNLTPGLINHHAVAGWEPEFGKPPIYVGSDNTVRWLINDDPVEVSTPDLRRLVTQAADVAIEALVYVCDGVPFCEISGSDETEFTWVLNCSTGPGSSAAVRDPSWHERQSYLIDRSRFTGSVFAFNEWLCGDFKQEGRMLQVSFDTAKEVNDPLIATVESLPVEDFPNNISVPRADFEFTTGVGIATGGQPYETDPQAEISWSNDGGQNWTIPRLVKIGPQSQTKIRPSVWKTGLSGSQGRRWRVALPAAVHFGLVGGAMKGLEDDY